MDSLFELKTHWDLLDLRLGSKAHRRGNKGRFAEALRIQPAFLSQILSRKFALSLEQADLANQFFEHTKEEADFFLLLTGRDRAGTASLQKHYEAKIAESLKKRQSVVERLGRTSELTGEAQGVYYSSWIYAAVHMSCSIPTLRTRGAIARYLSATPESVARALEFLEQNSLVKKEGEQFLSTNQWVRLDKSSPHIIKLHSNWRQKAIQNLEFQRDEDLHYSGLLSMDGKTASRIKDGLLDFVKASMQDIAGAKDENLFVLDLDLFQLGK